MSDEREPGAVTLERSELSSKLERIRALLAVEDLDAALLTRPENFAWITGGREQGPGGSSGLDPAGVLITADRAIIITSGGAAPYLPNAIGLDQIEYPWSESTLYHTALNALHRGAQIGADNPLPVTHDIEEQIENLRADLTVEEQDRFRSLYSDARLILDEVCGLIRSGKTERSIAARCAGFFLSAGIALEHAFVAADDRDQVPYPIPSPQPVVDRVRLSVAVRRAGLVASFTRLVCFGTLSELVARRQQAAIEVTEALIGATRPGAILGEVVRSGIDACGRTGFPDAWRRRNLGGPTGYRWREAISLPGSSTVIVPGHAFVCGAFIEGAVCEETILVTNNGPERL
ncbi:MAG TPA: M24 family metallopeptidase [Armatimonadota bacterium]|nr:M24 family metallopeptidase [Armatimonadota bacterium]